MEATEAIELFDSYWFKMGIFKKEPSLPQSSSLEANPDHENREKALKPEISSRPPAIITRSMSEDLCSKTTFNFGLYFSSDSVLQAPRLHTVFSGKEVTEEEYSTPTEKLYVLESSKKKVTRRGRKKVTSKSLSELEYEELKGFKDLGFVFSEKDKDSNLASIIPGLQRLGKKHEEETILDEPAVSRPYLSEAWEVQEKRRKEEPLMNWAIPALSNEIDMKDNLRWWAHTVASAI